MENPTRIKVAAAATAIAVGGLAGAGIALRNEGEPTVATSAAADSARPVVIHRKRVKRVPAKAPAASSSPPAVPTGASSAPAASPPASSATPTTVVAAPARPAVSVAAAPEPVSSRTSPAGSGGGAYDSEQESNDHGEHEGGD